MSRADYLQLTAFGEMLVGTLKPQAAWRFDYGINTRIVEVTTANGGTVTMDGNRAKLATSASVNGSARIETIKRLRYFPGIGGLLRMTSVFSTPKVNSKQLFGLGDGVDGLFYGTIGTDFVVGKIRGGVYDPVLQENWNGNYSAFNIANGNVFQIRYQWLGYGYLRYYMLNFEDETAGYMRLHTNRYPNTSPDVHILNPTLPLFAEVANTGNNTNMIAYTPSVAAFSEGDTGEQSNPLDVFNSFDAVATFGNTSNNHLLTIRNKSLLGAITNRVPIQINSITISRGTGENLAILRMYRNITTTGALAYVDIDTTNSPVDTSITTTTVTSTNAERSYSMAGGGVQVINFIPGEMVIQPGTSIGFGEQNSTAAPIQVVITVNWSELF